MSVFDPTYGELLTSKEVTQITGFTSNQLRNWRLPARLEKAPFGFVYIGATPHYRKASVLKWLDTHQANNVRYVPAGADLLVPIEAGLAVDAEKQLRIQEVSQIVSDNAYFVWYANLWNINGEKFDSLWKPLMMKYRSLASGLPESELVHIPTSHRLSQPEWFTGAVPALREIYALFNGFELTEEEILSTPIGTVPPMKEKNR